MLKHTKSHTQSGNALVIVLAVLVVAGLGGLAYFYSSKANKDEAGSSAVAEVSTESTQPAAGDSEDTDADAAPAAGEGNPVVAKLKGGEVTRLEVFNFIQTLPKSVFTGFLLYSPTFRANAASAKGGTTSVLAK